LSLLRELGARDGDRRAGDLQDVARPGANAHEVVRREPRDRVADIFDPRFRDPERQRDGRRCVERLGRVKIAGGDRHGST